MFAIEGLVPFLIFAPRRIRFAACAAMTALQILILATGNYGFFNLLALALCLLLLDDGIWPRRWLERLGRGVPAAGGVAGSGAGGAEGSRDAGGLRAPAAPRGASDASRGRWPAWVTRPALLTLFALSWVPTLGAMRWPAARLGPIASLYRFVSPLRAVDSYGLFAVMTTSRREIIVEGSADGTEWLPYEFRYKPGDVTRRPRFVAPHQPRLDWQMWFAALSDYRRERWFLFFCQRLLEGSPPVIALLATNPFPHAPPRFIRAVVYDYHFTDPATRRATSAWWRRDLRGLYCPILTLEGGRLMAVPPGHSGR